MRIKLGQIINREFKETGETRISEESIREAYAPFKRTVNHLSDSVYDGSRNVKKGLYAVALAILVGSTWLGITNLKKPTSIENKVTGKITVEKALVDSTFPYMLVPKVDTIYVKEKPKAPVHKVSPYVPASKTKTTHIKEKSEPTKTIDYNGCAINYNGCTIVKTGETGAAPY